MYDEIPKRHVLFDSLNVNMQLRSLCIFDIHTHSQCMRLVRFVCGCMCHQNSIDNYSWLTLYYLFIYIFVYISFIYIYIIVYKNEQV